MKEFLVTMEYRLRVKAETDAHAACAAGALDNPTVMKALGEVEVQGCDVVCITEETDDSDGS